MSYNAGDLLDQLMGPNRNLAPGEKPKRFLHWSDKSICKYYLCGFCPFELFTNTKADLGNCPNVHLEELKKNYEESEDYGKMGYEESFLEFITKILNDCERKVGRGRERLRNRKPVFIEANDREAYERISDRIDQNLKRIEELGIKGKVHEANELMEQVEDLRGELAIIGQRAVNSSTRYGYDREMEVCTVCGSLTLVNDLPSRFEDHLNGRQHMGYARIRTQVKIMNDSKYWKPKLDDTKETGEIPDKKSESSDKRRSRDQDRRSYHTSKSRRSRSRSNDYKKSRSHKSHRSEKRSKSPDHRRKERRRSRSRDRRH